MPPKSSSAEKKARGSCCSLEAVKYFLQSDTIPEGYNKNDKRALRRRAKSFVLIGDELYFTGGRSRHNRGLLGELKDTDENPENEPDHTQTLRKVLFSEEEQQAAVEQAHIAEDGSHSGMEKTTERVSSQYYWMGIIYTVRNTIHNCLTCGSRSKNIVTSWPRGNMNIMSINSEASGSTAAGYSYIERGDIEVAADFETGADLGDLNDGIEGIGNTAGGQAQTIIMAALPLIKQEVDAQAVDAFYFPKEICSYFWQKVRM